MQHTIVSLADRPDLLDAAIEVIDACWAPFMLEDDTAHTYWEQLGQRFAAFQLMLLDEHGQAIGVANSVPEALQPVEIDREADLGRYLEPNVWVLHRL